MLFLVFLSLSAGAQGRMSEQGPKKPLSLKKAAAALLSKVQRVNATDTIYLNPQGERRNYDMSSIYIASSDGDEASDRGYFQTVCFGPDNDVYFNRLLPRIAFNDSWIRGEVEEGADGQLYVNIPSPQLTSISEDGRKFYTVAMTKDAATREWKSLDTCRFLMSADRSQLEFLDNGNIWLMGIDNDGNLWEQDRAFSLTQFDDTLVQVPASAIFKAYTQKYYEPSLKPKEAHSSITRLAFDGSDVYLKGFCPLFPDRWAKGHISGNKIAVPSQLYMGNNGNYITYFYSSINDNGTLVPADSLYLTFNADTSEIKSSRNDYMQFGYSRGTIEYNAYNMSYTKFNLVPAVPASPKIIGYEYNTVTFSLSALDNTGNTLDPSLLSYRVFVNGKPYVFSKADYPSLSSDMTDIPYKYTDFQNFDFSSLDGTFYTVLYPKETVNSLGLQSVYAVDGVEKTSDLSELTVTGIDDIEMSAEHSISYYDMSGRRMAAPGKGITIRKTQLGNGRVRTDKIMR